MCGVLGVSMVAATTARNPNVVRRPPEPGFPHRFPPAGTARAGGSGPGRGARPFRPGGKEARQRMVAPDQGAGDGIPARRGASRRSRRPRTPPAPVPQTRKRPPGRKGCASNPGPTPTCGNVGRAREETPKTTIQSGKSATDQSEIQHRVQAPLAALDEAPEPEPLPEAVRNRIMALREDLHPDHLRADNGDGETKVFNVDEDVKDSEGLKKGLPNGSGSSA